MYSSYCNLMAIYSVSEVYFAILIKYVHGLVILA